MRNVIKLGLVSAILLFSVSARALLPLGFGVNAGMNLSNVGGDIDDTKAKPGFQVGATVDFTVPIIGIFAEAGASFSTKGYKYEFGDETYTANAMYLHIPVCVGYKISALSLLAIKFKAGPYWAYGLGGKTDSPLGKFDTFDALKKNDFGLTAGVGGELLSKLTVNLGYDFGLTDISKSDESVKNRNAYLTVGYKF